MKKLLKQTDFKLCHYVDGVKIKGIHSELFGDVSRLSGNVTELSGNVTELSGNPDDCKITDADRENGINIEDLIVLIVLIG